MDCLNFQSQWPERHSAAPTGPVIPGFVARLMAMLLLRYC